MNARVIAVALTVSLLSLGSSHAWDGDGHRVVGSIADQLLKPVAKAKVAALLGFSLRIAGPWADCVKSVQRVSDTTFKYTHSAQFGAPCVPFEAPAAAEEQARMENFVQRNWMLCGYRDYTSSCDNTYHVTNVPIQRSEYSRIHAGTNDRDIVQTINAAIAKLRGQPLQAPVSIGDQKEALVLLAHLVGDLHQPLHVGAIYLDAAGGRIDFPDGSTPSDRNDAHGGNLLFDQGKVFHTPNGTASPATSGTTPRPTPTCPHTPSGAQWLFFLSPVEVRGSWKRPILASPFHGRLIAISMTPWRFLPQQIQTPTPQA